MMLEETEWPEGRITSDAEQWPDCAPRSCPDCGAGTEIVSNVDEIVRVRCSHIATCGWSEPLDSRATTEKAAREISKAALEGYRDSVAPGRNWTFDEEVTAAFDDMLRRSIPQYDVMRETVAGVASAFLDDRRHGSIVDLGSSRGEAVAPLVRRYGARHHFRLIEISDPMLDVLRERFSGYSNVLVQKSDLRKTPSWPDADVTLSVLTLQFVPIEYRQALVATIRDRTRPSGAFILVEKILGDDARLDEVFVDRYWKMKRANGYSDEAIDRKALSLEGVLVPVTARWNVELLRRAGFRSVDCFWRWMNFAAWVALP